MRRIYATSRPSNNNARIEPMSREDEIAWQLTRERHPHWYAEMRHEEAALAKSLGLEPEPGMMIGIGWAFAALFCLISWGAIAWAVL